MLIAQVEADCHNIQGKMRGANGQHHDNELLKAALRERVELLRQLQTDLRPLVWIENPPAAR